MSGIFLLAWRYLAYHKVKTAVLVAAVATIVYLPAALDIVVRRSARELTARAQATPLLVGAKGSPLELVLNSLYFESGSPPSTAYAEVERVQRSDLAAPSRCTRGFAPDEARSSERRSTILNSAGFPWPKGGPWRCWENVCSAPRPPTPPASNREGSSCHRPRTFLIWRAPIR